MGLEHEIVNKERENENNKSKEKDHWSHSEPSNEVFKDVSLEDLKHAPFPHRLAKANKANLNAEIYDVFK